MLNACAENDNNANNGGSVKTVDFNLHCSGHLAGAPATVIGVRNYEPISALDGYVTFTGSLSFGTVDNTMVYEDYSTLAPFEGNIMFGTARIPISVLDATGTNGDKMIIYHDRPTLGPPTIYGEFFCTWS